MSCSSTPQVLQIISSTALGLLSAPNSALTLTPVAILPPLLLVTRLNTTIYADLNPDPTTPGIRYVLVQVSPDLQGYLPYDIISGTTVTSFLTRPTVASLIAQEALSNLDPCRGRNNRRKRNKSSSGKCSKSKCK